MYNNDLIRFLAFLPCICTTAFQTEYKVDSFFRNVSTSFANYMESHSWTCNLHIHGCENIKCQLVYIFFIITVLCTGSTKCILPVILLLKQMLCRVILNWRTAKLVNWTFVTINLSSLPSEPHALSCYYQPQLIDF